MWQVSNDRLCDTVQEDGKINVPIYLQSLKTDFTSYDYHVQFVFQRISHGLSSSRISKNTFICLGVFSFQEELFHEYILIKCNGWGIHLIWFTNISFREKRNFKNILKLEDELLSWMHSFHIQNISQRKGLGRRPSLLCLFI